MFGKRMIDRRNTKDGHNKQQDGKHRKHSRFIMVEWLPDGRTEKMTWLTTNDGWLRCRCRCWCFDGTCTRMLYLQQNCMHFGWKMGEMVRNKLLNGKKLRDVLSSIHSYMQSCSQVNRCNCTQQNVTVNNMGKQETDKLTDRHAESQDSSALNITRRRRIKPKPVEKW